MQKDKARDIARGVLPSTARKGARENKRDYHAKHRQAQRQANHAIERAVASGVDDFDDLEDPLVFDGYHARTKASIGWDDMGQIVSDRRGADKLGPLISWATATEKDKMVGWDVEDKINYFKAILPDNLQGRHALGHVKQALGLYTDEYAYGGRRYYREPRGPQTKDEFRGRVTSMLSTSNGRRNLRDLILETVPVAAHRFHSNNGHWKWEQARDENGASRYHPVETGDATRAIPQSDVRRPVMVEVWVPQIVTGTCDDCSFLRNDPLATPATVNRFVDIVWTGRRNIYAWRKAVGTHPDHTFMREIYDYITGGA